MTTKPDESTSRKAIVATLVTTILSPLSLILGFYLGHALQKPRLSIVDLDQSSYLQDHTIPAALLKEVAGQPLLVNTLRGELMRTALAQNQDPCTSWLDGGDWQDRCTDPVLLAAHGLASALVAEPSMPIPELLKSMRFTQAQRDSLGMTLRHLVAEMEAIQSDTSEERTGNMDFDVGILNTGDFDGVVARFGRLIFDDGSFTIRAERHTVVKAHGFETIQFAATDVAPAQRQAFDKWQLLVKTHAERKFTLELESGEGKRMTTQASLFK